MLRSALSYTVLVQVVSRTLRSNGKRSALMTAAAGRALASGSLWLCWIPGWDIGAAAALQDSLSATCVSPRSSGPIESRNYPHATRNHG